MSEKFTYNPAVFSVPTTSAAMATILTTEGEGADSDTRWQRETPYLIELIADELALRPGQFVIDYGCGIGRLAKGMIERFGCFVLGVDISASMRALAIQYVGSDRFCACAPDMLDNFVARGIKADAAIAVWVLQHSFDPEMEIKRLRSVLSPGAGMFVVNNKDRAVPTVEEAWVHDGIDIRQMLERNFSRRRESTLDPAHVTQIVTDFSFVATYVR